MNRVIYSLALIFISTSLCAAPDETGETITESCTHSCERSYAICGDSSANRAGDVTEPQPGFSGPTSSAFGASAACDRSLKDCLKDCNKQPVKEGQ